MHTHGVLTFVLAATLRHLHSVTHSSLSPSLQRAGNAFLAFNNHGAMGMIPFLSPLIAPSARLLGPILTQIAASPVRSTVEVRLHA